MTEWSLIRETAAEHLREQGVPAQAAWDRGERTGESVVAVSVRKAAQAGAALWEYLGERYNAERETWDELYGRRVELTLGLDIYAPGDGDGGKECQALFDAVDQALDAARGWLRPRELKRGEVAYREEENRFFCPVEAECTVFLCAVADESGVFREFTVRGKIK